MPKHDVDQRQQQGNIGYDEISDQVQVFNAPTRDKKVIYLTFIL